MNPRYFDLPLVKQKNLINAGYKVFAACPYKKASMAIIADEADISKSLLFYYFKNKKEYYFFLFDTAVEFMNTKKEESTHEKKVDLFKLVSRTVERRLKIMSDYPYLLKFVSRAYYEYSNEVSSELEKRKKDLVQIGKCEALKLIDRDLLENPSDAEVLVDIILCIAKGCMRGNEDLNDAKIGEILPAFRSMMESLKSYYYKHDLLPEEG
jgi:AcrR family transcriptional regulator